MVKYELDNDGLNEYYDSDDNKDDDGNSIINNSTKKYEFHIIKQYFQKLLDLYYYGMYRNFKCLCFCQITIMEKTKQDLTDIRDLDGEIDVY